MKVLKICLGIILFGALITVVQLADTPLDTPAAKFQQLPDMTISQVAEAEWAVGHVSSALLLLDYSIDNNLPDKARATESRQKVFAQLANENAPANRVRATGWSTELAGGSSFANLAGSSIADGALYGEIAQTARQGGFDQPPDDFVTALNNITSVDSVFPAADGPITLAKAARRTGAINDALLGQLSHVVDMMRSDPKS